MKITTKILSVFMALLMVVTCIPMTAFAKERDTSSLDAYLSNENLAVVVEDLLTALGDRKEEVVPSVLSICFQLIDALKEQAAEDGVDVMTADTNELATSLIKYVDKVLEEENLNESIKDYQSTIQKLTGLTVDLNSVDSILNLLVEAGPLLQKPTGIAAVLGNFGDAADIDVSMFEHTPKKGNKKAVAISTKNTDAIDIIYALFDFISDEDNIGIIKKVVEGTFTLGKANDTIKGFGIDIDAEIANLMGNLDVTINEMLYNELIAEKETVVNAETGEEEEVIKVAYAESVYVNYTCDELLAAALLKLISGTDATHDEAKALTKMTLYEIIGKYADQVIASFAIEPLNNDLKVALNDLIAMDPQLDVLKSIINMDYEFTADTFNFAEMAQEGLFENLNNMVCKIVEVLVQPAVYTELGLKAGGNENITHNLTAFFGYLLKTLATNNGGKLEFTVDNVAYSFDFSEFTADKIAGKSLEDMLVAVVGLFYPTLLEMELPADVNTLEKLCGFTAYVCIDKFMVQDADIDFNKDYKALVFNGDKVRDISKDQWNNVLGEMGMDVAIYWLSSATNFGMTQADIDALKAKGWTWEDLFEEIVDWALNYIDGIPAVADHLTTERGVQDGTAWYKLNVILNEFAPLAFVNGCEDETFTFDLYTFIMEQLVPSLYDCDFAAFANLLATNDKADNPFNQAVIPSVLGIVDNLIFSIFVHECEDTATFTKEATATHDGYKGTYCVENGHYVDVTVIEATGTTAPQPSETTTEDPKPSETTTEPPVTTVKLGDVTGDGKVNAVDARIVLRTGAKLETLEGDKAIAADVNKDGKINAVDARKILRVSAQLETLE